MPVASRDSKAAFACACLRWGLLLPCNRFRGMSSNTSGPRDFDKAFGCDVDSRYPNVDRGSLFLHVSFMAIYPLRFRFAHRAFAAFRAICFRRLAETVFILAFADFRPNMAKYSDSFLSIIFSTYPKPLSISTQHWLCRYQREPFQSLDYGSLDFS
jgi:hypothetical protein